MRLITEHSEGLNRVLLDGIKIFDNSGWVFINPHREKSLFNILVEAEEKDAAQSMLNEWKDKLHDLGFIRLHKSHHQ